VFIIFKLTLIQWWTVVVIAAYHLTVVIMADYQSGFRSLI